MNRQLPKLALVFLPLLNLLVGNSTANADVQTASWHCDKSPLLIADVRLIGETKPVSILIRAGRIQWIKSNYDDSLLPPGTRALQGDGATVIPGLVDSHAHFDSLAAAQHLHSELDTQTEVFPITFRQTLASGVTLARTHLAALADMPLMSAISEDDCFPAPRLTLSGPGLLGGAPAVNARLMRGVDGPADASKKVEELADHGADWIALHNISGFSESELEAIASSSRARQVRLMADTEEVKDFAVALNWPIRSGEYINRTSIREYPAEIVDVLSARDTPFVVTPPIGYYRRSATYSGNPVQHATAMSQFVGDDIGSEMTLSFADAFAGDKYIQEAVANVTTHRSKFQQLRDAGAVLIVGSDSGSLGQFHHDAIWHELTAWRAYGVSIEETIAAATEIPAGILDRRDTGVLQPGARADLVVYGGDISSTELSRDNVVAVVKGGVVYVANAEWVGPTTEQTLSLIADYRNQIPARAK